MAAWWMTRRARGRPSAPARAAGPHPASRRVATARAARWAGTPGPRMQWPWRRRTGEGGRRAGALEATSCRPQWQRAGPAKARRLRACRPARTGRNAYRPASRRRNRCWCHASRTQRRWIRGPRFPHESSSTKGAARGGGEAQMDGARAQRLRSPVGTEAQPRRRWPWRRGRAGAEARMGEAVCHRRPMRACSRAGRPGRCAARPALLNLALTGRCNYRAGG